MADNKMEISEAELKEDNEEERVEEDFKKISFANFFNGDSVIKTFYQDFPTQSNVSAACKEAYRIAIKSFVDGLLGHKKSKKELDLILMKSSSIVLAKHCAGVWDRASAHKWFQDYLDSQELEKTIRDAFGIFVLRSYNDILKLPVAEQMAVLEQHTTAISSLNCAQPSDCLADFMFNKRDSIPRPLEEWKNKQNCEFEELLLKIHRFYNFLISDFEDMGHFVDSIYKCNVSSDSEYPTSSDIVSRVVLPGSREAVLAESATCRKYLDHYYEFGQDVVRASVVILAETTLPFVGTLVTLAPKSHVEGLPKDAIWIFQHMFATATINSDKFPQLELDCPCFSVWNFCTQTDDFEKADVMIEVSVDNQITVRFLRDRRIGDEVVMWNPARHLVVANHNNDKLILARELVNEIVNANNEIAKQLTSKELEVFNDGFVKSDVSRVSAAFELESWPIIGEIIRTYIYPYNTVQQAILDIYNTVEGSFKASELYAYGTPRSYAFFSMWRRHLLFASVRRRFSFTTAKSARFKYWKYTTLYTKCHVAMFRSNVFSINIIDSMFDHYCPDCQYLMRRDSPKEAVPRATSSKRKTSNGDAEVDDNEEDNGAKRSKVDTVDANGSVDLHQSGASGETATVVSRPVGMSLVDEEDSKVLGEYTQTKEKAGESYMNNL